MFLKKEFLKPSKILFFAIIFILVCSTTSINLKAVKTKTSAPPGLPDFYVNDDWEEISDGTVVIDDFIIDYTIGKNAFASIQDALDQANAHDKIYVFQGTYNENLVIGKNKDFVEIEGIYGWADPDPKDENIINGHAGDPVILLSSETHYVAIHGFIITNDGLDGEGIVDKGSYNEIFDNTIKNIGGTGVFLTSNCYYAKIYHNNFIDNGVNAKDDSHTLEEFKSMWYKNEEGNYWDDHPGGLKRKNRRIWLNPYQIPGTANNQDNYPWVNIDGETKSKTKSLLYLSQGNLLKNFFHFLQLVKY